MLPFLKWAGGKRWLFTDAFLRALPSFNRYVEPFLGGGAGYFAVKPSRALLSDLNPELIQVYEVVRDQPSELREELARHQAAHSKNYYYETRGESPKTALEAASRTLYLNRTCWNGLYRLNLRGEFNVPIGTKSAVILPTDDFEEASRLLSGAEITCGDFAETIDRSGDGDLVFVDPPYTVAHNMNGFVKYNEKIFSWDDQIRLRNSLEKASQRGAKIIVTNADHATIHDLYFGLAKPEIVSRASIISGSAAARGRTTEVLYMF